MRQLMNLIGSLNMRAAYSYPSNCNWLRISLPNGFIEPSRLIRINFFGSIMRNIMRKSERGKIAFEGYLGHMTSLRKTSIHLLTGLFLRYLLYSVPKYNIPSLLAHGCKTLVRIKGFRRTCQVASLNLLGLGNSKKLK